MSAALDISATIVPKSDQLNADDLIAGPITVQITGVTKADGEQPVSVSLSHGYRPWKPCKTMRRVLVVAWGADASVYEGRWVKLYRDNAVRFGGDEVGGIRIEAMSDIPRGINVALTATRGKKAQHRIAVLTPPTNGKAANGKPATNGAAKSPLDGFRAAVVEQLHLDPDAVCAWAAAIEADLSKMDGAAIRAFFQTIKPDGANRKSLDEFLAPSSSSSTPDDGAPAGDDPGF